MLAMTWENWNLCDLLVGLQNGATAMQNSMAVPQKLKIELPYDPVIPLLSVFPEELEAGSPRDTWTSMCTAALSTTAKSNPKVH